MCFCNQMMDIFAACEKLIYVNFLKFFENRLFFYGFWIAFYPLTFMGNLLK